MADEFQSRGVTVVAVAQEDTDLASHGKFHSHFKPAPRFEIVADIGRSRTAEYDRTTSYLIDRSGTVRQIFPNLIHHRASWRAILREVDRVLGD